MARSGEQSTRATTRVTHVREFMFAARFWSALEELFGNTEAQTSRKVETSMGQYSGILKYARIGCCPAFMRGPRGIGCAT